MAISRTQMGSQLTGNRVSTGDDARDLDIIRFGKGGKTKKKSKSKEPKDYTLLNKVMGSLFFAFAMFLILAY